METYKIYKIRKPCSLLISESKGKLFFLDLKNADPIAIELKPNKEFKADSECDFVINIARAFPESELAYRINKEGI